MMITLLTDRAVRTMITMLTVLQAGAYLAGPASAAPLPKAIPGWSDEIGEDLVLLSDHFQRLSIATAGGCEWSKRPVEPKREIVAVPSDREFNLACDLWLHGEMTVAAWGPVVKKMADRHAAHLPSDSAAEVLTAGLEEALGFVIATSRADFEGVTTMAGVILEKDAVVVAKLGEIEIPVEAARPDVPVTVADSEPFEGYLADVVELAAASLADVRRGLEQIGEVAVGLSRAKVLASWQQMRAQLEAVRRVIENDRPIQRIAIDGVVERY
ncbi:hypothetical protein [Stratiformator vulcanicus]|uniref:Uncharacterized protein n=1 Tax=Stratiformator vulcanicus TaxID=2527980 RepID=A0A517R7Q0_9PLAN|nr:hypothetical protein [Stratiformator vulcanicus]QDT39853.1 hypothetical protein Pan189_42650 [Stratiformator vulcanicus]